MNPERRYYENTKLWAGENYGPAEVRRVATLSAKLPADAGTLLDVGCGSGLFLKYLLECRGREFGRLCGTDRSSAALAHLQGDKVQSCIDALPFSDGEFDAVSCMEVLEHLPEEVYLRAVHELSRVSGRYILISVPYNENIENGQTECDKCWCRFNPNYHLRNFNEQTVRHLFDGKGFRCLEAFRMHSQKTIPFEIQVILELLGIIRRKLLRRTRRPMPAHTVCPACGYSPSSDRDRSASLTAMPEKTIGMKLGSMLTMKSTWRWMGALYKRV
jgi:cyclopropane fatty-acyl-phospholipid synthase-like methyltransferase